MSKQEFNKIHLEYLKRYNQLLFKEILIGNEQIEFENLKIVLEPYFINAIDFNKVNSDFNLHINNISNPHLITKAQIGLSNVPNTDTTTTTNIVDSVNKRFSTDLEKIGYEEGHVHSGIPHAPSNATDDMTSAEILTAIKIVDGTESGLDADLLEGQHGAYYLDMNNATNKPDPVITLGGDATGSITLTDLTSGTLTMTIVDDSHNHVIANVDNLQIALDTKEISSNKGIANGYASLDSSGLVPAIQLPSYVDDILEFADVPSFPITGQTGKLYLDMFYNKLYRWSGTVYIYIPSGAVDSVAGKTGVVSLVKTDVGLPLADNTTDISKNVLSATKLTTARNINGVSFDGTANITIIDGTKEPIITADLATKFWSGTKTWRDLETDIRASVLTGLSLITSTAIVATDSILISFGKLQAQITAHIADAVKHITATERTNWGTAYTNNHVHANLATLTATTASFLVADETKLDSIATGATANDTDANLKNRANHTGNQASSTISDFVTSVLNTALTGLSTVTNSIVTVSDTVLTALGKLQKQISDNLGTLSSHIGNIANPHAVTQTQVGLGNVLNINTTTTANITDSLDKRFLTDTEKIGYEEGHVHSSVTHAPISDNLKANLDSPVLTNIPTAPTATAGTNTAQIATTAYVQTTLTAMGAGDMARVTYDTNLNGIVDNSEKVNNCSINDMGVTTSDLWTASKITTQLGSKLDAFANAISATKLVTPRAINGVNFDGTANVTMPTIYDSNYSSLMNPQGGQYTTQTEVNTGAIAITLPVGYTNSMLRMTIKIYEYVTNEAFEVICGGYHYIAGTAWINTFAYIIGNPSTNRQFTVRFGYTSGGKVIVYIGELGSIWSYPQIFVTDVQVGYGGQSISYASGWSIGIRATAFESVTSTIIASQIGLYETAPTNILMNGAQSVGSSNTVARGNHVHPSDTSKQPSGTYATGTGTAYGSNNGDQAIPTSLPANGGTSTKTSYVISPDGNRTGALIAPNTNPNNVRFDFMNGAVLGGTIGNYLGVMTYSPWDGTSASTGDCSYQLAFGSTVANGGTPRLAIRNGIDATWGAWQDIVTVITGGSDTSRYMKYSDGVMIINMEVAFASLACTSAWGSSFSAPAITLPNFPVAFVEVPTVTHSCAASGTCWMGVYGNGGPTITAPGVVQVFRATSATLASGSINVIAIGRWK